MEKNTEYIIEMQDAAYVLRDVGQSSQFRDCPAKCRTGGHPIPYGGSRSIICTYESFSINPPNIMRGDNLPEEEPPKTIHILEAKD